MLLIRRSYDMDYTMWLSLVLCAIALAVILIKRKK